MMNILLVGGTGVLSTAVANEALKVGIGVTMINRGNRMQLIPKGAHLIKADKNDKSTIRAMLEGRRFDAVIDFLCYTDEEITQSFSFYSGYTKQYFFISSCAVYDKTLGGVSSEDSPKVMPIWSYSVNKWKSEEHLMQLARSSAVKYTVIRPAVTYGDTRIPYGVSPRYGYHWTLVARILSGKPLIRWNGGVNRCNMMRVEDFAVGVVGLIGNPKAYNEAFNICGDEAPSFNDVLDVMQKLTGREVTTVDVTSEFYAHELPERAGEILGGRSVDGINSNDKIKRVVPAFRQTIPLKEGVAMTYRAYKDNGYQMGIDWSFDGDCDRIIKKWCRTNKIDFAPYNLGFTDYLGNATAADKRRYYMSLNKNRLDVRILKLGARGLRLSKRALKKLLSTARITPPPPNRNALTGVVISKRRIIYCWHGGYRNWNSQNIAAGSCSAAQQTYLKRF